VTSWAPFRSKFWASSGPVGAEDFGSFETLHSVRPDPEVGEMGQSFSFPNWALFSSQKFCKIFKIPRYIKSLDVCIEY